MVVRCRCESEGSPDALCTYHAVRRTWEDRAGSVAEAERRYRGERAQPFFVAVDCVSAWTTADTQQLARDAADGQRVRRGRPERAQREDHAPAPHTVHTPQ